MTARVLEADELRDVILGTSLVSPDRARHIANAIVRAQRGPAPPPKPARPWHTPFRDTP